MLKRIMVNAAFQMIPVMEGANAISLLKSSLSWVLGIIGGVIFIVGLVTLGESASESNGPARRNGIIMMAGGAMVAVLGPILVNAFITNPPTS